MTTSSVLERATPESQGIASSAILQFVEAGNQQIEELHSVMILRHGKVVAEGWWSPYQRENPHMLFSVSKSFTSTAIGFAIAEKHLSLDDRVLSFFPEYDTPVVNAHLSAMCIRHLLSMSTGHDEDTTDYMINRPDGDWVKGFFSVPVLHQPGTYFLYNTGATYMLSVILQKVTGLNLLDYLQPRLFQPLGIENPTWEQCPKGIATGGFGLSIKTEDIARFGQLYLQNGLWQGKQLLPEGWVEQASAYHVANGTDPNNDWNQGYGYQFWRCRHNVYRGDGAFGQFCVVMPEQDAVVAITGGMVEMQPTLDLIWNILLPAMQANPLPDDPISQAKLSETLGQLTLTPPEGAHTSPIAPNGTEYTYQMNANPLAIETIQFSMQESGVRLTIQSALPVESLHFGYEAWQVGTSQFFMPQRLTMTHYHQTLGRATWTDDHTLTLTLRLPKTPFYYEINCHFTDTQVTMEMVVNVSFDPVREMTLVGKLKEG